MKEHMCKCERGLTITLNQVREFHETFGHPLDRGHMMDAELTEARANFSAEEVQELRDATDVYDQVDSALDRIYFALGDLAIIGITNAQELMDLVHKKNMDKVWPDGSVVLDPENGNKVVKPPTWTDPKPLLRAAINRQLGILDDFGVS